jgi:hypothetical protein
MELQKIISPEETKEVEEISQRMAQRAGISTTSYETIPTIKVYNPSSDAVQDSSFTIGDFVSSKKTQDGWENEVYPKPITGIIMKVRMFLKTKFKYSGPGKQNLTSNEFDSFADSGIIIIKERTVSQEGKTIFEPIFTGNYKQVNDKYSLKDETTIEKKLELFYALYVLVDNKKVIRLEFKGVSRSNFFDYMREFTRIGGDFMTSYYTVFDTEISTTDMNGKARKSPIAAMKFTKGDFPGLATIKQIEEIQNQFEQELQKRDEFFGNKPVKMVTEGIDTDYPDNSNQVAIEEAIPTINLDDEQTTLEDWSDVKENTKDEIRIEDVPF